MYRYSNGQISLSDFQQPLGMKLREDNCWVKLSGYPGRRSKSGMQVCSHPLSGMLPNLSNSL